MSQIDDDPKSTLQLDDSTGEGYEEYLEDLFAGDWQKVDGLLAFECDLGEQMPTLRIEKIGDKWVGKLSTVHPPTWQQTEGSDIIKTAALQLRDLIRKYGMRLEEKGKSLIELSQTTD